MADELVSDVAQVPLEEGLFTWPSDDPRLIGARCPSCGVTTFPSQSTCPGCPSETMDEVLLDTRGTLWTFTTQEFLPKAPYRGPETADDWQPYAVGYVQLGDDILVEARLTESDVSRLRIGMEMELRIVPFGTADGHELVIYAFAPVDGAD